MPSPLDHGEKFVFVTSVETDDGMGGTIPNYEEGNEFTALMTLDNSMSARVAEKQDVKNVYSVLVDKKTPIKTSDIFKRLRDGKHFKVASDPKDDETPAIATFQVKNFTAEQYTLPA